MNSYRSQNQLTFRNTYELDSQSYNQGYIPFNDSLNSFNHLKSEKLRNLSPIILCETGNSRNSNNNSHRYLFYPSSSRLSPFSDNRINIFNIKNQNSRRYILDKEFKNNLNNENGLLNKDYQIPQYDNDMNGKSEKNIFERKIDNYNHGNNQEKYQNMLNKRLEDIKKISSLMPEEDAKIIGDSSYYYNRNKDYDKIIDKQKNFLRNYFKSKNLGGSLERDFYKDNNASRNEEKREYNQPQKNIHKNLNDENNIENNNIRDFSSNNFYNNNNNVNYDNSRISTPNMVLNDKENNIDNSYRKNQDKNFNFTNNNNEINDDNLDNNEINPNNNYFNKTTPNKPNFEIGIGDRSNFRENPGFFTFTNNFRNNNNFNSNENENNNKNNRNGINDYNNDINLEKNNDNYQIKPKTILQMKQNDNDNDNDNNINNDNNNNFQSNLNNNGNLSNYMNNPNIEKLDESQKNNNIPNIYNNEIRKNDNNYKGNININSGMSNLSTRDFYKTNNINRNFDDSNKINNQPLFYTKNEIEQKRQDDSNFNTNLGVPKNSQKNINLTNANINKLNEENNENKEIDNNIEIIDDNNNQIISEEGKPFIVEIVNDKYVKDNKTYVKTKRGDNLKLSVLHNIEGNPLINNGYPILGKDDKIYIEKNGNFIVFPDRNYMEGEEKIPVKIKNRKDIDVLNTKLTNFNIYSDIQFGNTVGSTKYFAGGTGKSILKTSRVLRKKNKMFPTGNGDARPPNIKKKKRKILKK